MLRTSLRRFEVCGAVSAVWVFLSSNAQDFIEDGKERGHVGKGLEQFLSSNAQDFIEENQWQQQPLVQFAFLSSNAQDFIEEHPQAQGRRAHPFLSSNAQDFIEDRR